MIRFILKRSLKDNVSNAHTESLQTIDRDFPDLERKLNSGGYSESCYDYTELIGVEVIDNFDKEVV